MLKDRKYQWAAGLLLAALVMAAPVLAQESGEGYLPTVRLLIPNLDATTYRTLPATFEFEVELDDPDQGYNGPVYYRYLLVEAVIDTTAQGAPIYITTQSEYEQYGEDLIAWDDAGWSGWIEHDPQTAGFGEPRLGFADLADDTYYLLAVQALDENGAVSIGRRYQQEVYHLRVRSDFFRPSVQLCEYYLGCPAATEASFEIAGGQPLNFSWIADASAYGGQIVSYRHGWDLTDPDDPNDPGWAGAPGFALVAPERIFQSGIHQFYLQVRDDSGQERLMTRTLIVIPFVDRPFQLPLLVIDQTIDSNSQAWPDQAGLPRDNEVYRNAFWQFLADGSGGVSDFDWQRDRKDHTAPVMYSDLVMYQAVLCYARANTNQLMFNEFRPQGDLDKYVWLTPYQQRGGNYFQVGAGSMDSFLEILPNYMIPIIFDTDETDYVAGSTTYSVGFGQSELPDGSLAPRGPRMYPYATAGIAVLDWTSPNAKAIYSRTQAARYDRHVDCVGLKGLVLDPAFQANHSVLPGALADTFFTDAVIDWRDAAAAGAGTLELFTNTFPFRNDEFVDGNISPRTTAWLPQECVDGPGGLCVEPMFTGIARLDWIRQEKAALGDPAWPGSEYTDAALDAGCGTLALTSHQEVPRSSGRTNGQVFGYLSYKTVADKPVERADVYWGFDPYRFDQTEAKKAVRWVLDYFGLNINP